MIGNAANTGIGTWFGRAFPTTMVVATISAGLALPATAQPVSSGDSQLSLTISGQVNQAILRADDGTETDLFFVDNADNLSTRLRVEGTGRFNPEIFVGTVFEGQITNNPTSNISIGQISAAGNGAFFARAAEVYADHARFGRFSIGHGETASNGTSEVDLSGTEVVGYSQVADFAGGINFVGAGGSSIASVYDNMDGFGRDNRFRYDSRRFAGGFTVSASRFEEHDGWDVAVRYSGQVSGFQVAAAAGYGDTTGTGGGGGLTQMNGSLSAFSRSSGFSVTVAGGSQSAAGGGAGDDPTFLYGKVGYQFNPYSFGATALAIDYATSDISGVNQTFTSIGIMAVQNIDRISTELYAGLRTHGFDDDGTVADDIGGLMVGARVKF